MRRRTRTKSSDVCHQLPSYKSALSFVDNPNLETGLAVVGSWVGRTLITGTGFMLCGEKVPAALKNGFIAATAIEVFVLGHAIVSKNYEKK